MNKFESIESESELRDLARELPEEGMPFLAELAREQDLFQLTAADLAPRVLFPSPFPFSVTSPHIEKALEQGYWEQDGEPLSGF